MQYLMPVSYTHLNAFACADGSVRVFSSLMDIMTDEELLGVIGHEVGLSLIHILPVMD